jgi:Uri superfamily endonuclease
LVKRGENGTWHVSFPNKKRSVRFDISPDVLSGGYSRYIYVGGAYVAAPARLIRDRSKRVVWYLEYPDRERKELYATGYVSRNVKGERQRIMKEYRFVKEAQNETPEI